MSKAKKTIQLPKKAKGSRPYFFEDPAVDKVVAMLMGLAGEASVMADRIDTLERLLEDKGLLKQSEIETYTPTAAVNGERDKRREIMLANVMRIILQNEEDPDLGQPNDAEYLSIIEEVEQV